MLIPEKSKLLKSALPKITQHNQFEDSFTVLQVLSYVEYFGKTTLLQFVIHFVYCYILGEGGKF